MSWPQGFVCGTTSCALKSNGDDDLAVVYSTSPCQAAGIFTRNRVAAAPVQYCKKLLQEQSSVTGVVINSKNANAVTGPQGERDARQLASTAARLSGQTDCAMLVMSTGVIGQPMPMDRYLAGLERACTDTTASPESLARAMMTTDTYPKVVIRDWGPTRWVGVAKGAGMIHPDMATLLALVVTDAAIAPGQMQAALSQANQVSFQCMTVDGDTSTNDSLIFLANGMAGEAPPGWTQVLQDILRELARMVAFDGEGASHRVTLKVTGLANSEEARQIGRTVLTSPLVKTAIAGKDANWGRILAAAGRAGVDFEPSQAGLRWNGLWVLRQGIPTNPGSQAEQEAVQGSEVQLELSLGEGPGQAELWSCDLTHEYVSINGDYRT